MGLKSQYQIGIKQRQKRKKTRKNLAKKGENLTAYYYGKYYIKQG